MIVKKYFFVSMLVKGGMAMSNKGVYDRGGRIIWDNIGYQLIVDRKEIKRTNNENNRRYN